LLSFRKCVGLCNDLHKRVTCIFQHCINLFSAISTLKIEHGLNDFWCVRDIVLVQCQDKFSTAIAFAGHVVHNITNNIRDGILLCVRDSHVIVPSVIGCFISALAPPNADIAMTVHMYTCADSATAMFRHNNGRNTTHIHIFCCQRTHTHMCMQISDCKEFSSHCLL